MRLKKILFCFLFLINTCFCFSQSADKQLITIDLLFEKTKFSMIEDTYSHFKNGDSLLVEMLRFYISNIEFWQKDNVIFQEKNSVHLIDAASPQTLQFSFNLPSEIEYDQLKFNLGIDSTTNVSGAFGGDLDPTKGMYWTWQSGYVNFKIEGKSAQSKARNNEFQYHLGGYLLPFYALQKVVLPLKKKDDIHVVFDVAEFLTQSDFAKKSHIMSPSTEAVSLSERVAKGFSVE
ncbi:MAG: hypothetical protein RLZZ292_2888 [Bacteroidota bacterium]|jgi:hypothetical protein